MAGGAVPQPRSVEACLVSLQGQARCHFVLSAPIDRRPVLGSVRGCQPHTWAFIPSRPQGEVL